MSVSEIYEHQIAARRLERDGAQEQLLARFVALEERVAAHRSARRSQPLGWLFGTSEHQLVRGLYVHCDVGRGKTMMMDVFFEASPIVRKLVVAFTAAALTLVSVATTVMAATGGGDFPRLR